MLSALAWIYGKITDIRNSLYDRGVFETHDLGAHTISIGNITTGGTGKTPLVALVAHILAERGEKVCILTRGYGRKDPGKRVLVSDGLNILADAVTGGDEPVELARKLLGKAIVIADRDRVAPAEWAKRKFGVTAFVLDDGFQHRRARRDVDIVCIDAADPFGGGRMLPAGRLRESRRNVSRSHVVVLIQGAPDLTLQTLRDELQRLAPSATLFEAQKKLLGITSGVDGSGPAPAGSMRLYAFCGLAKPENFRGLLHESGIQPVGFQAFADHHRYTQQDIDEIESKANSERASGLITTAKDAVKLVDLELRLPHYVAAIDIELDDPDAFASRL